jgi:hypothetical protein
VTVDLTGYNEPQPMPTGDGELVSPAAQERIRHLVWMSLDLPVGLQSYIVDDAVCDGVCSDLTNRIEHGTAKYGTPLKTNNGRDAAIDGYQEVLDAVHYCQQDTMEHPDDLDVVADLNALIQIALRMRKRIDARAKHST